MSTYGPKGASTEAGYLEYEDSKVHFIRFGKGEKLLIALPGFGDQAALFLALQEALTGDYTVYAIDLPFHGKTIWKKESFSKKDITGVFDLISKKEQKERFELMGFSFGGRIILASISKVIDRLDGIRLIAPDGIRTKGMFTALIVPVWLRRLLKRSMNNLDWLVGNLEVFHKIGWLGSYDLRFIRHNMATPELRQRIFNTWISLNEFIVNLNKVKECLSQYPVPVELYLGKYDKIIPMEAGEQLQKGLSNIRLNIVEDGHRMVNENLNQFMLDQKTGKDPES